MHNGVDRPVSAYFSYIPSANSKHRSTTASWGRHAPHRSTTAGSACSFTRVYGHLGCVADFSTHGRIVRGLTYAGVVAGNVNVHIVVAEVLPVLEPGSHGAVTVSVIRKPGGYWRITWWSWGVVGIPCWGFESHFIHNTSSTHTVFRV